jgi:hypothetical protein
MGVVVDYISLKLEMGLDELLAEHVQTIHFSIVVRVHGQAPSAQSMASQAWSKTRAKTLGGVVGCGAVFDLPI